jgi:flagellar basal-body rod modification protein FlgD
MNIQGLPTSTPGLAMFHTNAASSANSSNASTPGANLNPNDAESMFMKMLVTELKSQDPTQAMDPMQMVGQMFQMNQLQQLIDINQTLSTALGAAPSAASNSTVHSNVASSPVQGTATPSAATAYLQQLMTGAH